MDNVQKSLKTLIEAVDRLFSKLYPDGKGIPTVNRWKVEENGEGEMPVPFFTFVFHDLKENLIKQPEYQEVINQINSNPDLSKVCTGWDITPMGWHRNNPETVIINLLTSYFDQKYENAISDIDDYLKWYLVSLKKTEIEMEVIAHLEGLYSYIEESELTDAVFIRKLTLEEINRNFEDRYSDSGISFRNSKYIIGSKFRMKRVFLDHEPLEHERLDGQENRKAVNKLFEVLTGLRLFKPGYLEIDLIQTRPVAEEVFKFQSAQIRSVPHLFINEYVLELEDIPKFNVFFNKFESFSKQAKEKFKNAIRWLNGTSLKLAPHDRFLDYVTILETLYLEQDQELSYRLKLRIAFCLEKEPGKRLKLYKTIGEAYKIRSKMVHTGKNPPKIVKIDGEEFSSSKILAILSSAVYTTIHRIIDPEKERFPSSDEEWDKLIFSVG